MAIFEKTTSKKVLLDDTEPLSCFIENWRDVNGHTEYIIRVQRGLFADRTWKIYKRYNDFLALHSYLQTSGLPLPLPPKKIIGNRNPQFICERQKGLQKYLDIVLMNPILISSLPAKSFVDPANYCQPFSEVALQHVSLALRGEVGWEVVAPLKRVGWRLRKHFYQVRNRMAPNQVFIASWTDFGPDKYLEDKHLKAIFKSFMSLKHPYIHSIELALCTDVGGLVVRTNNEEGSLRDIICGSDPRLPYLTKYGRPENYKALNYGQVALYGRQILEGLKFLQEKGLPYGHLHAGNIIIENDRVKLLDIENGILGVPSFYRPYHTKHKRICNLEAIDVYCFGVTLYEMAFGIPLQDSVINSLPMDCPAPLRSILEMILSVESLKNRLPTIDALLKHQFFSSVTLTINPDDVVYLRIPTSVKEHIKVTLTQSENRLKGDQKVVRSEKRLARVKVMMSSEEEKKKERHKKKQEQKQLAKEQQSKERQMSSEHKENAEDNGDVGGSTNSTSTTTSLGTLTPPSLSGSSNVTIMPPPPPPPPLLRPTTTVMPNGGTPASNIHQDRSALLGAICNFNKGKLRKAKSVSNV